MHTHAASLSENYINNFESSILVHVCRWWVSTAINEIAQWANTVMPEIECTWQLCSYLISALRAIASACVSLMVRPSQPTTLGSTAQWPEASATTRPGSSLPTSAEKHIWSECHIRPTVTSVNHTNHYHLLKMKITFHSIQQTLSMHWEFSAPHVWSYKPTLTCL